MRWKGRRRSTQVDDRRGRRLPGGRALPLGGGALLLIVVFTLLTGEDPSQLVEVLSESTGTSAGGAGQPAAPPSDELGEFASVVLADTEETWQAQFAAMGRRYELPTLVLFSDAVRSACGFNSAAVGPFYCPADQRVYLDLTFFGVLERRFGAPGDFAQAYVIAHEVGHHVQNLLGISEEVQRRRARLAGAEANALSVRMELQADCLAGVWGHHAHRQRGLLDPGDVEEGLAAAAAIGDDAIQQRSGGAVRPESWTHGSARERSRWLRQGLETGRPDACDTFAG